MEERSPLNRRNDRFKICVDKDKLYQIIYTNLKNDVESELVNYEKAGLIDPYDLEVPNEVLINIRQTKEDIVILGNRVTSTGTQLVVHVTLHLAQGKLGDIVGAIHGRSNTRSPEFVRYFFDYISGNPKLVTFGHEGWTIVGLNQKKYNTITSDSQRQFIHIVFSKINKYLKAITFSEEKCQAVMDEYYGVKSSSSSTTAASTAVKKENTSSSSSTSQTETSIKEVNKNKRLLLPRVTKAEVELISAMNNFFNFYSEGIRSGFSLFETILTPDIFINPNYLNNVDKDTDLLKNDIAKYTKVLENIELVLEGKDKLPQTSDLLNRLRRINFAKDIITSYKIYYERLLDLFIKVINAMKNAEGMRNSRGLRHFGYILAYLDELPLLVLNTPQEPITETNLQPLLSFTNNSTMELTKLNYLNFFTYEKLFLNYVTTQLEIDLNQCILEESKDRLDEEIQVTKMSENIVKMSRDSFSENKTLLTTIGRKIEAKEKEINKLTPLLEQEVKPKMKAKTQKNINTLTAERDQLINELNVALQAMILLEATLPDSEEELRKQKERLRLLLTTKQHILNKQRKAESILLELLRLKQIKFPSEKFIELYSAPVVYQTKLGGARKKQGTRKIRK